MGDGGNVDIVREAIEANRSGPPEETIEVAVSLAHPEIVFTSRITAVEGRAYQGHEGLRRYFEDLSAAFREWRSEVLEVTELGTGTVLGESFMRAVAKESGVPLELRSGLICRLTGGKLLQISVYGSREEALEVAQAETSETPAAPSRPHFGAP
jgi:ketosteroid isomerase-like protein